MKKLIAITFLAGTLGAGNAHAQHFTAPLPRHRAVPPEITAPQGEGAIQRGFRMGNPAQMINPFAPAEYGTGEDFVEYRNYHDQGLRPRDRSRNYPVALRLFSIPF